MIDDLADWIRLLNATLTLIAMILAVPLAPRWVARPIADRFLAAAGLGCAAVLGWGAVEAIIADIPGGSRVLLATPFHAWMTLALILMNRDQRRHHEHPPR